MLSSLRSPSLAAATFTGSIAVASTRRRARRRLTVGRAPILFHAAVACLRTTRAGIDIGTVARSLAIVTARLARAIARAILLPRRPRRYYTPPSVRVRGRRSLDSIAGCR
jgi:hypothetical protein